jgi:hypothetical protein
MESILIYSTAGHTSEGQVGGIHEDTAVNAQFEIDSKINIFISTVYKKQKSEEKSVNNQ